MSGPTQPTAGGQGVPIHAQVRVHYRDGSENVYEQAAYLVQGYGSGAFVTLRTSKANEAGEQEFAFPWEDVEYIACVPSKVKVATAVVS